MHELNEAIWDCHFKTNCRVTRHYKTTSIQKHGRPAETEPAATICAWQ